MDLLVFSTEHKHIQCITLYDWDTANSLLLAWWAETPLEISNKQIFHTVSSIWFMWDQKNMNTANTVWNAFKSQHTNLQCADSHQSWTRVHDQSFRLKARASNRETTAQHPLTSNSTSKPGYHIWTSHDGTSDVWNVWTAFTKINCFMLSNFRVAASLT